MLRWVIVNTALGLAVFTITLLTFGQTAAAAQGGSGTGGPFGSVQCGQTFTPSCTVSAGSPGKPGTAGFSANVPAGSTVATCNHSSQFGCVPPGCQVTLSTLSCPIGNGGPGAAPASPAPAVLAQLAVRYLVLPSPVIQASPAAADLQLVYFPTWLWISRAVWAPRSRTAFVPGERVTATATPVSVSWRMGDGSTVVCHGPGTPYSAAFNPDASSPDCGHTYTQSSAAEPGGAYRVTASITWDITWAGSPGAGGTLPPLLSTSAAAFRVAESQAINTGAGGR